MNKEKLISEYGFEICKTCNGRFSCIFACEVICSITNPYPKKYVVIEYAESSHVDDPRNINVRYLFDAGKYSCLTSATNKKHYYHLEKAKEMFTEQIAIAEGIMKDG